MHFLNWIFQIIFKVHNRLFLSIVCQLLHHWDQDGATHGNLKIYENLPCGKICPITTCHVEFFCKTFLKQIQMWILHPILKWHVANLLWIRIGHMSLLWRFGFLIGILLQITMINNPCVKSQFVRLGLGFKFKFKVLDLGLWN
jgi:hypothetical protein